MFKFYNAKLKLDTVQHIAKVLADDHSAYYAKTKPEWFERYVQKILYWYADPNRIKNPISILIANGFVHGIHPGTSKFLGAYLAGVDTIPALVIAHVDAQTPVALEKYLVEYYETDDYEFVTDWPCPNSFQPKTRNFVSKDNNWMEDESVDEINSELIWSKHPNLRWVKDDDVVFEKVSDPLKETRVIEINNFHEFWDSLIELTKS